MVDVAEQVGRRFAPVLYAVGREKIREFAAAVGETDPLFHDLDAARAAGHPDLLAPPMFAVVYGGAAVRPVLFDPALGIDFARVVHGAQAFRWPGPPVRAGEEITTVITVGEISERAGLRFYRLTQASHNAGGRLVCEGTWTIIVRGQG
jgi:acyl dehydratase